MKSKKDNLISDYQSMIGRKGGLRNKEKYGKDYFSKIRKGVKFKGKEVVDKSSIDKRSVKE